MRLASLAVFGAAILFAIHSSADAQYVAGDSCHACSAGHAYNPWANYCAEKAQRGHGPCGHGCRGGCGHDNSCRPLIDLFALFRPYCSSCDTCNGHSCESCDQCNPAEPSQTEPTMPDDAPPAAPEPPVSRNNARADPSPSIRLAPAPRPIPTRPRDLAGDASNDPAPRLQLELDESATAKPTLPPRNPLRGNDSFGERNPLRPAQPADSSAPSLPRNELSN